jgi:hypothetical protein
MIHTCPDCGLVHDHVAPPTEDRDVAIARIQAQSAEAIARINARADTHIADVQAEADQVVTETLADAEVAAAEVQAEVLGDAIEAAGIEEPPPVVVDPGPEPEPEPDPEELPPAEGSPAPPAAEPKRRGLGMW